MPSETTATAGNRSGAAVGGSISRGRASVERDAVVLCGGIVQ